MVKTIPVEVSARHCHLSREDIDNLFGRKYTLEKSKRLSQPSDFAAKEKVQIYTKHGIMNLRVVGPERKETQVEISVTDALKLGIMPALRISGDLKNTPGAILVGPKGRVRMKRGIIVALRHIHCTPAEARKIGIKEGKNASVRIGGSRGLVLDNIKVRTGERYRLCCHIDTDEGNAAGINKKAKGYLL